MENKIKSGSMEINSDSLKNVQVIASQPATLSHDNKIIEDKMQSIKNNNGPAAQQYIQKPPSRTGTHVNKERPSSSNQKSMKARIQQKNIIELSTNQKSSKT